MLKAQESKVFIPNHHEGYIDWNTYEENIKMIRNNCMNLKNEESGSPVRKGQGILAELLRCRRCGRKLTVEYSGRSGTAARYKCQGYNISEGKYCIAFGGSKVDKRFSRELLKVLSPLGMRASFEAVDKLRFRDNDARRALSKQIEQLKYEADRAFYQYDQVDPHNRLVATELERRWNAKLEELVQFEFRIAELDKEVHSLTEQEREEILEMGRRFERVWESEHCPIETKKKIIRTVVEEAIVDLDDDRGMLSFVIHWKGGAHTQFEMPKVLSGIGQKTSIEDLDVIRKMALRYGDNDIARVLNKLDRRTATG